MTDDTNAVMIREIAADLFAGRVDADVPDVGLAQLWPTVVELGWPLVGIDDARGGAGGTLIDLGAVVASVGHHGVAVPLLEQALSNWILTTAGEGPPDDRVSVASPTDGTLIARGSGTDLAMSGELGSVPWADDASRIIAVARHDHEDHIVVLDNDSDGVRRDDETNLAGEPRSVVTVENVQGRVLAGAPSVDQLTQRGALLSTAAMVGAMEAALELTRTYVAAREQFGRPLAKFQAVSSSLAQMSSAVSVARSAIDGALARCAAGSSGTELAAAVARVAVLDVATSVGVHAHDLHGAMGITREYPLHRFTRRIWAWRDEWGSERSWRHHVGSQALLIGPDALWDEGTTFASNAPS